MNRRNFFSGITGALAALGITAKLRAIEQEPEPMLLAITCDTHLSQHAKQQLRESFEKAFKGAKHPPVVVLDNGMDVKAIPADSWANDETELKVGEARRWFPGPIEKA